MCHYLYAALQAPPLKSVWLDNVLVLPHDVKIEQVLEEEALDQTAEFISQCGKDSFYIDKKTKGNLSPVNIFSITTSMGGNQLKL